MNLETSSAPTDCTSSIATDGPLVIASLAELTADQPSIRDQLAAAAAAHDQRMAAYRTATALRPPVATITVAEVDGVASVFTMVMRGPAHRRIAWIAAAQAIEAGSRHCKVVVRDPALRKPSPAAPASHIESAVTDSGFVTTVTTVTSE